MKKIAVIIAIVTMAVMFLTACSNEDGSADSENQVDGIVPVELTIWHDKEYAVANVLQVALDELQPEIIIHMERKHGLTEALKLVGNDPRNAPDFYFFAHDKLGVYAEMGIRPQCEKFAMP